MVSSGKSLHVCCFGLVGFRRCLVEQGRQAIRRLFLCCRLLSAIHFVVWGWVHVGLCLVLGHLCRVGLVVGLPMVMVFGCDLFREGSGGFRGGFQEGFRILGEKFSSIGVAAKL